MLAVPIGILAGALYATFGGLYRSSKAKAWGWFWAILLTWLIGLGWLVGAIYLLGPGRKAKRVSQAAAETPADGATDNAANGGGGCL